MSEEVRFFLRIGLYTLPVAVVYWFVSYEIAGSVMLLALGLSAVFFTVASIAVLRHTGARDPGGSRAGGVGAALNRLVGFEESDEAANLATEDEPIPTASAWPLLLALGATLLGLGLIFGGWLWIPGAVLMLVAGWGWITQLD